MRPEAAEGSLRVPVAGDVIASKYRVEGVVGTGGMGMVLSALHLRLGQSVAIKVLTMAGISEARRNEAQARFLREAQAAAGLTSDHVVRVFDVGTLDSGVPYMVMELLAGSDLGQLLEREGPLPLDRAVDYVAQACDAIAEAHAHGIVHRDLKPSNLFLARKKDGRTTVKVLDFGISKAIVGGDDPLDGNLTATRSVVGSPYYMSPEQVRDAKRVDTRTDVWSLGMILYELLIGAPAFDAETLPGICAAIVADPPPPIRMTRRDVPIELEGVILRCLEKNPALRFQTVEELQQALIPFLPASAIARISGATTGSGLLALNELRVSAAGRMSLANAAKVASGAQPAASPFELDHTAVGREPSIPGPAPVVGSERAIGEDGGRRSPAALIAGVAQTAVLAAAGYAWFSARPPAPATAAAAGTGARHVQGRSAAEAASFTLTIESTPAGAQVLENERVLGLTPIALAIDAASVRDGSRQLWLKRDGHVPYHIVQGPSPADVKLIANLTPLPVPQAPAAEAEATEASDKSADSPRSSSSARRRARHAAAAAAKSELSAPLPDPSEIRLER